MLFYVPNIAYSGPLSLGLELYKGVVRETVKFNIIHLFQMLGLYLLLCFTNEGVNLWLIL